MILIKDYSSCPPKKRPIPPLSPDPIQMFPVGDENEEPEDLSLKTRQRLKDYPPEPPPTTSTYSHGLISPNTPISFPVSSLVLRNTAYLEDLKEGAYGGIVRRPSVLRAPIRVPRTPQAPLRERVSSSVWSYHPYLTPLTAYGLPSQPAPSSLKDTQREHSSNIRSGSASPPGEPLTETSSGSDGGSSPELPKGEGKMSCPECGRGYATVAGLSRHQQFHCLKDASGASRTFSCKHCAKTYTSVGALKMHIRTHTLPCKCHVCGKAFSRPWLLQGHIRTHTGEKPFECPQCHRSFADRSNLRAHLQTHADVKKYACSLCPKTFSRMSLLTKHQDHGCPGLGRPRTHFTVPRISTGSTL